MYIGNAFVHLQVGLGQVKHLHHGGQQDQGGQQGGGPAMQIRRFRREAQRKASAEQAAATKVENERIIVAEKDGIIGEPTTAVTEEVIDGDKVSYNLEIESFESSTENDVVEVLEANFLGTLDEKSVEKTDPSRKITIENLK